MSTNPLNQPNISKLWHPMAHPAETIKNPAIIIEKASGVEIEDVSGHRTIDAVGGLWCVNLGYSNHVVKEAIRKQLDELPYYNCFRGTGNIRAQELCEKLIAFFYPEGMGRVFLNNGGSDSVESCLKLARQYHRIRGEEQRTGFISLSMGYHGTHFGGASVGGMSRFQIAYEPMVAGCSSVPTPWPYRNSYNEDNPTQLTELCLQALRNEIEQRGANTIAAFIMEPVIGSGGVIVPEPEFMPAVRQICDQHGILLIADEVICAFGRTGAWSGSRLWKVQPDMMSIAKGLSNGFFPIGAALIGHKVAEIFEQTNDAIATLSTGYTYSGHPIGCAAALASIDEAIKLNVAENARVRGLEMSALLHQLKEKFDIVGDIRGIGLMHAIELVSDKESRTALDKPSVQGIFNEIYKAGVMIRISANLIIISPPLIITADDVLRIFRGIESGLINFLN